MNVWGNVRSQVSPAKQVPRPITICVLGCLQVKHKSSKAGNKLAGRAAGCCIQDWSSAQCLCSGRCRSERMNMIHQCHLRACLRGLHSKSGPPATQKSSHLEVVGKLNEVLRSRTECCLHSPGLIASSSWHSYLSSLKRGVCMSSKGCMTVLACTVTNR